MQWSSVPSAFRSVGWGFLKLFRQNPRFAATDHFSEWGVRFFEKPRYGCLKPSARSTNNDEHLRRWLDLDVKSDSFRFRGLLNFQHIPMYQCIGISKIAHILIYIYILYYCLLILFIFSLSRLKSILLNLSWSLGKPCRNPPRQPEICSKTPVDAEQRAYMSLPAQVSCWDREMGGLTNGGMSLDIYPYKSHIYIYIYCHKHHTSTFTY